MSSSTKPLKLYTSPTPNGHKPSIFLEEINAAYGLDVYEYQRVQLNGEQKEPWFLKINPNGRIPAITDRSNGDFNVFESAAILLYVADRFDKDRKLSFDPVKEPKEYSEALQWIFFAHGGVGPMQGQANHFGKFAPEKIPYAITRYLEETKRLYSVLDTRLADRDWLAGAGRGKYSLADINVFPWVRVHAFSGIETLDQFPNLKSWVERISERPAVQAGLNVPPRQ